MFDGLAGRQYHIQKWDESYQLLEYSGNQEYAIYTTERSRFIEWDSRFHIPFGQWLVFWDQYVTMALWLCNERMKDTHSNSSFVFSFHDMQGVLGNRWNCPIQCNPSMTSGRCACRRCCSILEERGSYDQLNWVFLETCTHRDCYWIVHESIAYYCDYILYISTFM